VSVDLCPPRSFLELLPLFLTPPPPLVKGRPPKQFYAGQSLVSDFRVRQRHSCLESFQRPFRNIFPCLPPGACRCSTMYREPTHWYFLKVRACFSTLQFFFPHPCSPCPLATLFPNHRPRVDGFFYESPFSIGSPCV